MVQVMLFSPATVFVGNQLRAESLLVRFFVCPPNLRKRSYSEGVLRAVMHYFGAIAAQVFLTGG